MSLVEYTKLVVFILGVIFSPLQEEEVSGVYFDVIHLEDFTIESYIFERKNMQGDVSVFDADSQGEHKLFFEIVPNRKDRSKFMIEFSHGHGSIMINLAEYLEGIDDDSFSWNQKSIKILNFKSGNSIIFRKVGQTVYFESKEFPDLLFCVHIDALTQLGNAK
jgi:hypothetical protein